MTARGEDAARRITAQPKDAKRLRSLFEMHKVLVPRLSGIHRFACMSLLPVTKLRLLTLLSGLALYRALLRRCAKLPTTALDADVKALVQQKFHRYRNLQSPSQTSNALKAGYEVYTSLLGFGFH